MQRTALGVSIALLLALAGAQPAAGQQDSLPPPTGTALMSGRVLDAVSGEPVAGASVFIRELGRMTITNEYGGFVLDRLPEGSYTWTFRRLGYADWEAESPVRHRDWFTVRLLPQPEVLAGLTVVADGFERRRRRVNASVLAIEEAQMMGSAAGNAHQLLMSRGNIPVVACGTGEVFSCMFYRGDLIRPAIYVDDQPFIGGLQELAVYATAELHLVEVMRWVGGVRIYVTTRAYAERLARFRREPPVFVLIDPRGSYRGGGTLQEAPAPSRAPRPKP
jgi:hypothetical protein